MSKRSYAARLNRMQLAMLEEGFDAGFQKAADLFLVALAAEFGFGAERIGRVRQTVDGLDRKYGKAWRAEAESDWAQKQLDAVLERVCGEAFTPFEQRNPYIRQLGYGKRR